MAAGTDKTRRSSGLAVDEAGGPVIDPTENVIALTEAANKRQDDLREANDRLFEVQIECIRNEVSLRAEFAREIRTLNDDRLEKIRQVDVLAGNTAADRALVAIQTLATTQAAAAETLRSMVTTTATTIATQNAETVAQLSGRIAQLEKSSYEGAGKQTVADPMLVELIAEVKALRSSGANKAGEKTGRVDQRQFIQWVIMLILAAIAVAGYLK